ncbi:unnamed protein product [Microthlaspi erraticum]|uniref:Tryptophan--tRNA ligase, cytoplasmic n=1 Tax=Microthlaspi erraticum TaxID=1685480 RepID=A0A6D2JA71_9BRAS|nr:unnamed protein product [Microthlaspi erraticum]
MAGKLAGNNSRQALGESSDQMVVTPFEVSAKEGEKIDYNKLIDKFGCQRIKESLIDRVESLTGRQPHVFLRRGVFFAHRDLDVILDAGAKFYLYTGRGPSSEALHLGHLIPFMFTKYLQEAFKVPLVIQLTDDEKFTWKNNLSVEETKRLARENAKDIIACGFDVTKTSFSRISTILEGNAFYENMVKIGRCLGYNKAKEMFGFSGDDYIAKLSVPLVQAAPSFASSFPQLFPGKGNLRCLIPCAVDQDSCFRMARDFAPPLGYRKPALIESSFFPALQGVHVKVSASDPDSAIYLTDTAKAIARKINKKAFSGGKDSEKEHIEFGANLEKDIPFKYLSFFLEDDIELEQIRKEYGEGPKLPGGEQRMMTGAVKKRVAQVLTQVVERHRRARADVTEELVDAFMAVRPLPTKSEAWEQVESPRGKMKMDDDKLIDESLIDRVKRLTGREPHVFLRRGVFNSHQDFNEILDAYEGGEMFYLFSGRGASSEALRIGDLIPLMFTKYLQEAFGVPVVVQLRDDGDCSLSDEEVRRRARESAKDIIACGFDVTNTFIFSDLGYIGGAFYKNMVKIGQCVTVNKARGIFGFSDEDCLSKYSFPPVQASPSFPSSFPHLFSGMDKLPCLIPCAIDQDPYFRMTRDVAPRLGFSKPSLIESTFFPGLQGFNGKMSASDPNSAIYVTDTAEDIAYKINKCKQQTDKECRDLEEDIPFQYLSFFLEDDDELERIRKDYGEGKMLPGDVKKRLIEVLTSIVERHRSARAAVTDEMVDTFMAVRLVPTIS